MSILKNINYIAKMNTIPCGEASWYVYIETAFKSAPPALLTLFLPGCTDILKMRIGNSPWHLRGIKGLIKGAIKPYPIAEQKFLYNIGYYTAEKYLWYFMVADVTTEFVTTWQSMVFQQQQCELPGAGTAYGYPTAFVYQPTGPAPLGFTPIKGIPGVLFAGSAISIAPGLEASLAYTVNWDTWPVAGKGALVSTWYTVDSKPEIYDYNKTQDPALHTGSGTAGHLYHKNPGAIVPTVYHFHCEVIAGEFCQPVGGTITISASGNPTGTVPWGCKPKPVSWPFP